MNQTSGFGCELTSTHVTFGSTGKKTALNFKIPDFIKMSRVSTRQAQNSARLNVFSSVVQAADVVML